MEKSSQIGNKQARTSEPLLIREEEDEEDELLGAREKKPRTSQAGPSSSSDEGMGSQSNSSAQSSTAGSHCDDRETPPHVAHSTSSSSSATPAIKHSISCDNLEKLSASQQHSQQQQFQRPDSFIKRTKSRSRTLTNGLDSLLKEKRLSWSASLSSLGQSIRSNLKPSTGKSSPEEENKKTIFFHTSCFSCTTCNEPLVDLRALIYVHEHHRLAKRMVESPAHREYVNIDRCDQLAGSGDSEDEELASLRQQISLYCHRHFVELFKPRCQQCDCLILDEECTEAEGKSSADDDDLIMYLFHPIPFHLRISSRFDYHD